MDPRQFRQALLARPHLVLLGAGASRAATPDGDGQGRLLPLMNDFVATLGLESLLDELSIEYEGRDFEEIFSMAHATQPDAVPKVQEAIETYFQSLRLPEYPTIYDYLVLSLRDRDFIATFNWDPLLVEALVRNRKKVNLMFLHGNVAIGYCANGDVTGLRSGMCSHCGRKFKPSKLLYPITEKDYDSDPQIAREWEAFRGVLASALMFTIFGYSAPGSDIEAMTAIKAAWGPWKDRSLEEIELIDIRPEEEVTDSWADLIHTHHFGFHDNFFESWLGRQGPVAFDQFLAQTFDAQFIEDHPVPRGVSLSELQAWFAERPHYSDTGSGK